MNDDFVLKCLPLLIKWSHLSGLLNNIAEVSHLRHRLLDNDFVLVLLDFLQSESIDVSFFAAGILAHLTSDGDEAWKVSDFQLKLYTGFDVICFSVNTDLANGNSKLVVPCSAPLANTQQ